jgi:hypothetical protein
MPLRVATDAKEAAESARVALRAYLKPDDRIRDT